MIYPPFYDQLFKPYQDVFCVSALLNKSHVIMFTGT